MAEKNKNKHHTVMLVDDNEIDNLINQKMIEAADISEYIFVHSGAKSAIEFLQNIEKMGDESSHVLPELIFLDIDMPLMDGFQFLDEFNKLQDNTREKCNIVMLTSSINPQDVNKSQKYESVKQYINKPLTQENLEKLVKG